MQEVVCMAVLSKSQMSEEDIKFHYITPAITAKWDKQHITLETKITDGRINLKGNIVPVKSRNVQTMCFTWARIIRLPLLKQKTTIIRFPMDCSRPWPMRRCWMFRLPLAQMGMALQNMTSWRAKNAPLDLTNSQQKKELVERYKAGANDGAGLTDVQEKLIAQPYYSNQNTYPPRYYQRIAINRTLDAIARGQNRLLLVMATGTGKTYTAFQIVYRLLKSGLKKKILYLADRNNLVDQSIQQDFAPLEKVIHKVNFF